MNHYELLAIVSGRYTENEVEPIYQKIDEVIKKQTSVIHYKQNLDRKRLAYPISRQTYGFYYLVEFDAEPESVIKISSAFGLMQDVLRFQIIKKKTVGKQKTFERKQTLEQEAFGKRAGASLGDMDILNKGEGQAAQTKDPVMPMPEEAPAALVAEAVVNAVTPAPELAEDKEGEEKDASSSGAKKKQGKVSYEDLDKKLDDILNNDIL